MLFFVYTDEAAAAAKARLTVRRRQSKQRALPADLQGPVDPLRRSTDGGGALADSKAAQVDWRASVLLMVVLQSAYRLSVVTAEDAELLTTFVEGVAAGSSVPSIPGLHHVTKVVHASPRWEAAAGSCKSHNWAVQGAGQGGGQPSLQPLRILDKVPKPVPHPSATSRSLQPCARQPRQQPLRRRPPPHLVPGHLLRCGLLRPRLPLRGEPGGGWRSVSLLGGIRLET
jgi:hypothetical protein